MQSSLSIPESPSGFESTAGVEDFDLPKRRESDSAVLRTPAKELDLGMFMRDGSIGGGVEDADAPAHCPTFFNLSFAGPMSDVKSASKDGNAKDFFERNSSYSKALS